MSHLLPNLLHFTRLLRGAGIPVTPQQSADAARALALIDLARREDVRNVCRAVMVSRRQQIPLFDRAFDLFWRPHQDRALPDRAARGSKQRGSGGRLAQIGPGTGRSRGGRDLEVESLAAYSAAEILRHKPFARLTPDELAAVRRLISALSWQLPRRRTRRARPAPRGPYFDARRTLRQNLRYGGEPLRLARRARKHKPRPLVLLCDVSGSMARYSRLLLHFVYALGLRLDHVEAFLFSTRLTRITPHLHRSLQDALDDIGRQASDLGGGTQIGRALRAFNRRWARRVLGRGAIVLLISDGWDRGEPGLIAQEMARLHRSCHRLIWLNPHLGSPAYEPLTRGMRAALPHIDHFLPVHNLHSLEQLAALLRTEFD